ncbi:MAG: hypothetical protein WDN72_08250 [Alphaproteobacteria bacterium]
MRPHRLPRARRSPSAPAGGAANTFAPAAGGGAGSGFVINRQAGILSVNATQRQHEMIQRYLDLMTRNNSAQVLIEAKIVEVQLSDQFSSGIDWTHVIGKALGNSVRLGNWIPSGGLLTTTPTSGVNGSPQFTLGIDRNGELGSLVALTEQFGTTPHPVEPAAFRHQQPSRRC